MKVSLRVIVVAIFVCALASAQTQSSNESPYAQFPGKDWAVIVATPDLAVVRNEIQADGRQYLLAEDRKSGLEVSVMLEKSTEAADAKTCPSYLHHRVEAYSSLGLKNVQYTTLNGMPAVEYFIPEVQGQPVRQENVIVCTAKDDVYVDVHASKVAFDPKDEAMLTSVINSVRIVTRRPSEGVQASGDHDSRYYMNLGNQFFLKQQYQQAIAPYQKALDLEKQKPQLDKTMWRVLVDQLGMSYGISGDLDKAEEVFRHGLSKDPTYPMFSYNMACDYAERGNLAQTLTYLKQAFANRANVIPGETMPDPRTDDSFQRFVNDPKFQELMRDLKLP